MKCISCAIPYFVFKAFAKFLTSCHSMRSSASAKGALIPLDTSTSSAWATLEFSCSGVTAYYFWTACGPQIQNSWHSNGSKTIYTSYKTDLPSLCWQISLFLLSPPHFCMVTVTVFTTYYTNVNVNGKKKTMQQSGVLKYNMKAKCLQLYPISLFCTLIYREAQGRPQWKSRRETCTDQIKNLSKYFKI